MSFRVRTMSDTSHENLSNEPHAAAAKPLTSRQILGRSRCTVCRHTDKWRIELLKAGGASLESLGRKFNLAPDAIWRHWKNHVSPEARASYLIGPADMEALAEKAAEEGDSVLDYLRMCRGTLVAQMAAMNDAGDARGAAYVAVSLAKVLEAMARVTGEIGDLARSSVNFNVTNNLVLKLEEHPEFPSFQVNLMRALAVFPDARVAVASLFSDLSSQNARTGSAAPAIKVIEHHA
jgi:hypothetical protein